MRTLVERCQPIGWLKAMKRHVPLHTECDRLDLHDASHCVLADHVKVHIGHAIHDPRERTNERRLILDSVQARDVEKPPWRASRGVARSLKSDPRLRPIPIVAVTSYAMANDRALALAAGCDGYIEKPINPDTFVTEISGFLPPATADSAP